MTVPEDARQNQNQLEAPGGDAISSCRSSIAAEPQTQGEGRHCRQSLAALWESLPREQQLQLLTFDLNLLHARAYHVAGLLKLGEVLETGVSRLRQFGTVTKWAIPDYGIEAFESPMALWDMLLGHMMPHHRKDIMIPLNLKPALAQARQRLQKKLTGIQQKVVAAKQAHQNLAKTKPWRVPQQSHLIDAAITELLSGHEFLYSIFAQPIGHLLRELSSGGDCNPELSPAAELAVDFEFLDLAPESGTIDVAHVSDWVETKINSFCQSAQHGTNYTEEIPLFTLSGSKAAPTLAVSEKWLQQLEKQYRAEASTSSEAPCTTGSSCLVASGNAMLSWLYDQDLGLPCTQTLPGSMAKQSPIIVANWHLRHYQTEAAAAATQAEQVQKVITWIEGDINRPCNLKTHHESRCCPVHPLLQSVHALPDPAGVLNWGTKEGTQVWKSIGLVTLGMT